MKLRDVVRLHPETVTAAEQHLPVRAAPVRRNSTVTKTKPHPLVWKKALELSGGDTKRLVVESETSVLVRNK